MSVSFQNPMNSVLGAAAAAAATSNYASLHSSQKEYTKEILLAESLLRDFKYKEAVSAIQQILLPSSAPIINSQLLQQQQLQQQQHLQQQHQQEQQQQLEIGQQKQRCDVSFGFVHMHKLLGFAQLQCNFYQKAISTFYNLLKHTDDYETQVILLLIDRSPNLRMILNNIITFDEAGTTPLKFLADPSLNLARTASAKAYRIPAILHSVSNVLQVAPELLNFLKEQERAEEEGYSIEIREARGNDSNSRIAMEEEEEEEEEKQVGDNEFKGIQQGYWSYFCALIRSVLAFEYFAKGNIGMVVSILGMLQEDDPMNPKYLAGLVQTHAHFGDVRGFETKLALTKNIDLGYFKSNIFFGIEALFLKNRKAFSLQFLEKTRDHVPSLFLEKHQNVFTGKPLKSAYMLYRNQLVEIMKALTFEYYIAHTLLFHPNRIYLDLFYD